MIQTLWLHVSLHCVYDLNKTESYKPASENIMTRATLSRLFNCSPRITHMGRQTINMSAMMSIIDVDRIRASKLIHLAGVSNLHAALRGIQLKNRDSSAAMKNNMQ